MDEYLPVCVVLRCNAVDVMCCLIIRCRVEVVREQTPGQIHMSGLTFAINIRRTSVTDPAQSVLTVMHGSRYLVILDTLNDDPTIGWARDNRVIARERYHGDELSFYLFLLELEAVGDYEVMTQYLGVCYGKLSLSDVNLSCQLFQT